jgi:hypothetical protein
MDFPEEEIREIELRKSDSSSPPRCSLEQVFFSTALAEPHRCHPMFAAVAFHKADLVFGGQLFQPES